MFRFILVAIAALFVSLSAGIADERKSERLTILETRQGDVLRSSAFAFQDFSEGVGLTNPITPKSARIHTSNLKDRHVMNASLGEVSRSVALCQDVDDIIAASFGIGMGETLIAVQDLNRELNKLEATAPDKFRALTAVGVPEHCLLITFREQAGKKKEMQIILRTGSADHVLTDSTEGGSLVNWSAMRKRGIANEYICAGLNNVRMTLITNNY